MFCLTFCIIITIIDNGISYSVSPDEVRRKKTGCCFTTIFFSLLLLAERLDA